MLYNLQDELSRKRFASKVRTLWEKGTIVELTDKHRRSLRQNAYLHCCIGAVALETGNSLEVIKQEIYKRRVNPDLFVEEKDDPVLGRITVLRSSRDLDKEEMSLSIDRFRRFAEENGIYIPEPGDEELLAQLEYEIDKARKYML